MLRVLLVACAILAPSGVALAQADLGRMHLLAAQIVGTAQVAESECGRTGEMSRAIAWAQSLGIGFMQQPVRQSDVNALLSFAAMANAKIRETGNPAWCSYYAASPKPF